VIAGGACRRDGERVLVAPDAATRRQPPTVTDRTTDVPQALGGQNSVALTPLDRSGGLSTNTPRVRSGLVPETHLKSA